ncbi:MAG: hypothetical protein HUU06_09685 [Planctomycetaceae bacterium]|nr:hypothetical protein [Planctomycetaceae bacterium]
MIRLHDVRDLLSPGPGRDPVFTGGEPLLAFAHGALDRSCWCGGFPETTLENGLLVVLADADSQERLAGEFRALRAAAGGE